MKLLPLNLSVRAFRPIVGVVALLALGMLPEVEATDAEIITFAEISEIHSDVVVPVPSEIFNVLDKFDVRQTQWNAELMVPKNLNCKGRNHTALFLGSIVAEGFLAVEAEDSKAIETLGRNVLDLADVLGMKADVLPHSKSIINAANNGNWRRVRDEFDATRQTVREVMEKRRDADLAHCVSVGGWVRGTEIITAIILRDFSLEKSEILHQPSLLAHFTKTFSSLAGVKHDERLQRLLAALKDLVPLMSQEGSIDIKDVSRINAICKELRLKTIAP